MWLILVLTHVILSIMYTQFFKIVTKTSKNDGTITVLLQFIARITALLLSLFFEYKFPTDWKIYLILGIACIFYSISDRLNTTVRDGVEASTFSIINQLSTVFMGLAGLLFFKEPFAWKKIIGAGLIIFSNILIFYKKGKQKTNKYIFLGILANTAYSIALFLDVNISNNFNLALYVATTLLTSSAFITIVNKIKISDIKDELKNSNKKVILTTGFCWSTMIIAQLSAYQMGDVT